MEEKEDRATSSGPISPGSGTNQASDIQAEQQDTEKTSSSEAGFAPIRTRGDRRISVDTINTLRRERSNNGWGVDDLEEDDAGGCIAPYNHPNPEARDPFEVGWDGGDSDPLCPRSLPTWRKWLIIAITSVGSFCV